MPDLDQKMYEAILNNKPAKLLKILQDNPTAADDSARSKSLPILHTAIFLRNSVCSNILIDHMSQEALAMTSSNGSTPLHQTVMANLPDVAERLLQKSPKSVLETKDRFRRTPLEYAREQEVHDIVRLIEGKKPRNFVLSEEEVNLVVSPDRTPRQKKSAEEQKR